MSKDPRYHDQWSQISRHVRLLFNQLCARCGKDCASPDGQHSQLQVHHIDENPGNNAIENLIPLCSVCHLQIEKEARLHAPYQQQQLELFEGNNYSLAMEELRMQRILRNQDPVSLSEDETNSEAFERRQLQFEWER